MATFLSWSFLLISSIAFVLILGISVIKANRKPIGLFKGCIFGGLVGLVCFLISAFIGMNFY